MINPNWTILIQIANFVLLVFILNLVVYKPIRGILKKRKTQFAHLETNIRTINQEAETKNQSFDDGIKAARQKGQLKKDVLMKTAADEESAIVARISAKAKEDLAAVKKSIAKDISAVQIALEKEVDSFADAITHKILGRAA